MNIVVPLFVFALLLSSGSATLLGSLLSLTILPYTIIYNLSGIAGVKVALALKLLGLLGWWRAGISDATLDREVDFRRVELPTGAVFPGTPNLPVHMIPGILAEIVRSMVQDDNVGSGFFQREPAAEQEPVSPWARSSRTDTSPLGLLVGGGRWPVEPKPVLPAAYRIFEDPAWTDGVRLLKRSADTSSETQPPPGFFRRPRVGEPGRAPTARDVYGFALEMIQDIDADHCLLKLSCEVGAEPVRVQNRLTPLAQNPKVGSQSQGAGNLGYTKKRRRFCQHTSRNDSGTAPRIAQRTVSMKKGFDSWVHRSRRTMNGALVVVIFLVAASAWTAMSWTCPVIGSLLSLSFQMCSLCYGMLGNETFKLAQAYQFVGLFIRMNAGAKSPQERFVATVQPSDAARTSGESGLPAGMVPYQLAGMLGRILDDYTADAAAFGRRAESTKRRDGPVILISRAGWPVMPRDGRPSGFEHAQTDEETSRADRSAPTFPFARPARGFFRRPRVQELGRPPTAGEVAEHELEMIQRIDSNGCLQKLCCEIGAQPELYWRYHLRVVMFLRGVHKLVGDTSSLLQRYDKAFKKGHMQFSGKRWKCGELYKRCR
ncbi:hypothetical protein HPB50_007809 [Hyalomma asiaticum]|uniref:Uncharacterized protein n=1 Tax=Hyalomma asiaticum TaxID=266040 RepID=A0ACB7SWN9_HYAAI|nr:hypothetical protein HPB50_007809 [Hyalomma asiaticum]